jgi:hypothetical protein
MKWVHLVPKLHEGEEDLDGLTELFDGYPEDKQDKKPPSANKRQVPISDSNVSKQVQVDAKQESTQTDSF